MSAASGRRPRSGIEMKLKVFLYSALCAAAVTALRHIVIDELIPIYVIAVTIMTVVLAVHSVPRDSNGDPIDPATLAAFQSAQQVVMASREVKARVPKSAPRREDSAAARLGETKVTAARSMASLIRKARLRETVIDICDCADHVIETIRRMPEDTPSARIFSETHLSRFNEALEKCFELSRSEVYKSASAAIDREEIECFTTFIIAFRRQQDNILFEGLSKKYT